MLDLYPEGAAMAAAQRADKAYEQVSAKSAFCYHWRLFHRRQSGI
jgi:hypothetical protein